MKAEVVENAETEEVKDISAREATEEVAVNDQAAKEEVVAEEAVDDETIAEEGATEEESTDENAETTGIAEEELSEVEGPRTDNLFRLNKNKLESNIVVKGSIDLDAINDRTRPPRKSRAQRKKERLEREQKVIDGKKLKEEKVKLLKKRQSMKRKNSQSPVTTMRIARRKNASVSVRAR